MSVSQRLELRQAQSLVMTPQLQQAIKLLQFSHQELTEFVAQEVEQNPLLEPDTRDPESGERESDAAPEANTTADVPVTGADRVLSDPDTSRTTEALDTDYDNDWTGADAGTPEPLLPSWQSGGSGNNSFAGDDPDFENQAGRDLTLREHLLRQIGIVFADPADRLIAYALTEELDEAGFLRADLDAVALALGTDLRRIEVILGRLQGLDPSGIYARSVGECLALQLKERDRCDPAMQALLDHLELLAERRLKELMAICGVDAEDLADMVQELKGLNPRPAAGFDAPAADAVTPDVIVRANPRGGWLVELNPDAMPRVLVNQTYYAEVAGVVRNKSEKEYLSDRLQAANWLVKSLHQRATTIIKVASQIIAEQDRFMREGVQGLKPLILRDIATAIGMHESTVSRVTTNKFIATPRGTFEMKYFFSSAIAGADGEASHSAEAVKHRIKTMIDAEPASAILSDDKIVTLLRADGVDIARRTVAKYREALRIPSSVQRRREKRLHA